MATVLEFVFWFVGGMVYGVLCELFAAKGRKSNGFVCRGRWRRNATFVNV
jgi:hypothetical protein